MNVPLLLRDALLPRTGIGLYTKAFVVRFSYQPVDILMFLVALPHVTEFKIYFFLGGGVISTLLTKFTER
jgi:hypothetical protein